MTIGDSEIFGDSPLGSEPNFNSSLGRISGKLLAANLRRNGTDLTFDTDLLHLNVTDLRVGVKTTSPTHDLHTNGTTRTTNLIVDGTDARISNVVFNSDGSVTTLVGALHLTPTGVDPIIEHERVHTSGLEFNDNYISGLIPGQNIEIRPNGTGDLNVLSGAKVNGSLNVTQNILTNGDVNVKGYVQIGDVITDTVTVNPDFTQSIIPGDDILYDLGTTLKRWRRVYLQDNDPIDAFVSTTVTISDQTYIQGNSITSLQSNDNLHLRSDTGTVVIESLEILDNTITNLLSTPLRIEHTGNGYLRFAGTFGIQIPAGTTAERQGNAVGDTRWNTDLQYMECFDGTVWQVATGGGETVTAEYMEDLGHQYTLIFG